MEATSNRVRLAFFGTGNHATQSLYPCLTQIPGIELAATFSRNGERAAEAARRFGGLARYTSPQALLDNEAIDGAIIVGPPQMHSEIALACLERRVPVFLEKPPAIDTESAARLVEAARAHGTWGMVGFNKRHATAYRIAREVLNRPGFGDISFIDVKFANGPWPPFWEIEERGISYLIGQAIHMFDLCRYFGGEVTSVYAQFRKVSVDRFGFAVQFAFAGGALATLNLTCFETWGKFNEVVSISGDGDFLTVENVLELKYYPKDDWVVLEGSEIFNLYQGWQVSGPMPRTTNFSMTHLGYLGELEAFTNAIRTGTPPAPGLEDGLEAMRLCDAVWQSAQRGRPVDMGTAPIAPAIGATR